MVLAVIAAGVLHELLPVDFRVIPQFVVIYPLFLLVFLVVLIVGDPGRIDRERRWLRVTTALMIGFITVTTALGALRLVRGILTHGPFTTASQLLTIGAVAWLTNVIAFSLWFWDLDAGGAAARASGSPRIPPAFVFPEMNYRDRRARVRPDRRVGHQALGEADDCPRGPGLAVAGRPCLGSCNQHPLKPTSCPGAC